MAKSKFNVDGNLIKKCTVCKQEFTLEFFNVDKYAKHERCGMCRECSKEKVRMNKEKVQAYNKSWRDRNKEKHRSDVRFLGYKKQGIKITKEEYYYLLNKQKEKCAICEKSSIVENKRLCLDHCHKTGKVRGFLCPNCNMGLGLLGDDSEILIKAYKYLVRNKDNIIMKIE